MLRSCVDMLSLQHLIITKAMQLMLWYTSDEAQSSVSSANQQQSLLQEHCGFQYLKCWHVGVCRCWHVSVSRCQSPQDYFNEEDDDDARQVPPRPSSPELHSEGVGRPFIKLRPGSPPSQRPPPRAVGSGSKVSSLLYLFCPVYRLIRLWHVFVHILNNTQSKKQKDNSVPLGIHTRSICTEAAWGNIHKQKHMLVGCHLCAMSDDSCVLDSTQLSFGALLHPAQQLSVSRLCKRLQPAWASTSMQQFMVWCCYCHAQYVRRILQ